MASVVFFRAANVGGRGVFRPKALAAALPALEIASIGAAGTLVVRADVPAAKIAGAIAAELPFVPELLVIPGRDVAALVEADPFREIAAPVEAKPEVGVLAETPPRAPAMPLERPETSAWQVRIVAQRGRFVLALRRPGTPLVYTNGVVEKEWGVPATTRTWGTMAAVAKALA